MTGSRYRWLSLGIFVLSSTINYLDRQALATLAPVLRAEFRLSNSEYGLILTAFSIAYAASAPFAGMLIDRVGLNRAISLAVGVWSWAGIFTGFTRGLTGLVACRTVLGIAEAAGIPAAGKAIHQYLLPRERALGNALNQAGISLGLVIAPPLTVYLAERYGWREAFILTGTLGLVWIPVWNLASRTGGAARSAEGGIETAILRDRRLWGFMVANALSMIPYSLWTNWLVLYLTDVMRLTLAQAARFAWIPPLFATLGGLVGGWLSLRWMEHGLHAVAARTRVCLAGAVLALATALIPLLPNAAWASGGISLSILAVAAFSVNMYTLPLDTFGGPRAAFAVSMLVSSYGAMQAVISPIFGVVIDRFGYAPLCVAASVTPLAAYGVLKWTELE